MKFNAITVHCTSLCLDVMTQERFYQYSVDDIKEFRHDVYIQILNRLDTSMGNTYDSYTIASTLADEVVGIFLSYHRCAMPFTANSILMRIQNCILGCRHRDH